MFISDVMDNCQLDKNGCSHECSFNHDTMTFACLCPHGMVLSLNNKDCEDEDGKSEYYILQVPCLFSKIDFPGVKTS